MRKQITILKILTSLTAYSVFRTSAGVCIMPIKYAKTQVTVERGTGRKTTKNFYMHMEKIEDLIAEYNKTQGVRGKGKLRQKIKNDSQKRWSGIYGEGS